jgi:hypothetical protein
MKAHRLILPTLLGLALAGVLLFAAMRQSRAALEINPYPLSPLPLPVQHTNSIQGAIRYVATSGADTGDCTNPANPCRTVQYAVDQAAEEDEVRVAAGLYTDTHIRPRHDITTTGYVTQVVYISKTITIQGGYTLTDWTNPDPIANPTMLDTQGLGRVIYVTGTISPTISGLHITGGDASNQGGWDPPDTWWNDLDVGGGLYLITATAVISGCEFYGNSSPQGGGAALVYSSVRFVGNRIRVNSGGGVASFLGNNNIISNTFSDNTGGGLYLGGEYTLQTGNEKVIGNTFTGNSNGLGGGILLWNAPPAIVARNIIVNNNANQGAGIYSFHNDPTLSRNLIIANQAGTGGGLYLLGYDGSMDSNLVASNSAGRVGGLYLDGGAATVSNNMFSENRSNTYGSGIAIDRSQSGRFMNNTIARNTGGDGMGITVMANNQIAFTNTIIVSQSIGIFIPLDINKNTVLMEGTLWGSGVWANGQDWAGSGTFYTGTVNVWGDPGFVDPDYGDYHIGYGSAAVDAGVDAGVYNDIDGEARPAGAGFDIGADELQAALRLALLTYPDPVASGQNLTYTLLLTNTGIVDLHALITATLQEQVTPGGTITWTATLPALGGTWTEYVIGTVDADYAGPLTSTLKASTLEGAHGAASSSVIAVQPVSGLTALNSSPTVLGQVAAFTATMSAGSDLSYAWDFGDGTTGSGAKTQHTYQAVGIYTATVTASNLVSQGSADTQVEIILTGYDLYIPTIYSNKNILAAHSPAFRQTTRW